MSAVNEIRSTPNRRTDRELQREEATIARKYLSRVPWEMVVWGLGNFVVWLSLWPLVFMSIPAPLGLPTIVIGLVVGSTAGFVAKRRGSWV